MTTNNQSTVRDGYIGNLVLPIIILSLAIAGFILALDFPTGEDVGPAVVPYLWITFTISFCIVLIVQALLRRGKPDPIPGKVGFVILFVGWLVVYLASINAIGYFVSTLVFLVGSMYILTYRNHFFIFVVSFCWLAFSYVVFVKLLFIPLPIGPFLSPLLE